MLAVGLFIKGGVAFAMPLPSEQLVGDYTLSVIAMGKTYEFSYPEIDTYLGELYLKNAEEVVEGIYFDTAVKPVDASVKIYPERENPFEYTAEKNGEGIDKSELIKDIKTALYARKRIIYAKKVALFPTVYEAELRKNTALLSSFSTDYSSSSAERKTNIKLAVKTIGGKEIKSGETFSFNSVVGERSAERGYRQAKIIENGKFTDGLGGGICQVSSTLYNAVLLSGLTVTERHNHSLAVSYVEPSFDAMVNSGSSDLKFKNEKDKSLYIVASCDGGKVKFRVYGTKDGYVYKRVSKVTGYISPPEEEIIKNAELPLGERKVITSAKKGIKSEGYIEKYYNGKLTERKKLSEDTYAPVKGVIEVGTKSETVLPEVFG